MSAMTPLQEELGVEEYARLAWAWSKADRVGPILLEWPEPAEWPQGDTTDDAEA